MKIIKEGKQMITGTTNVTCNFCDAELEIDANDLVPNDGGILSSFYYYKCPCCSQKNWLAFIDLPSEMRSDIRKRIPSF